MPKILSDVQGSSETVGSGADIKTPIHVMLIGQNGLPITSLGGTLFATLLIPYVTTGTTLVDV